MVIKRHHWQEPEKPPPPMDESWWEAVLAEEQAQNPSYAKKNPYNGGQRTRAGGTHKPSESPEMDERRFGTVDWQKTNHLYEQDQVVELLVTGFNRGGLLVNGEKIQGFVPISHLVEAPCREADAERWLEEYIDRTLNLKIIECDQERGRVVFSERAAQSKPGSRKQLLTSLCAGSRIVGTVTNITDFGVFVDLGGVEGLVHVSEISWGRVHHPADVILLGQLVEAYVIQVDQEKARVALSMKRLYPNPWDTANERYFPGQVTEATVTSIVPFGAFARLEEGLDGLIHISEFSTREGFGNLEEVLKEGQQIQVRILHVDAIKQRLGLSLSLNGERVQPI